MTRTDLIFTQASVFHLQKLAKDVHNTTGTRHRLSDQNSMLKLLKTAILSSDGAVQHDLENFARDLDERQLDNLRRQGVMLKRTA